MPRSLAKPEITECGQRHVVANLAAETGRDSFRLS
jgi:hypothetical protein